MTCAAIGPVGAGDAKVGAYDWRMTLTADPANMVPIPEPSRYDPAEFELLRRIIAAYNASGTAVPWGVPRGGLPNGKTDWKVGGPPGFNGECVGCNLLYPNASWEEQQAIVAEHKRFTLALLKFWREDPAVPSALRALLAPGQIGLCRDEYNRTADHWMPQLYVRTALRLRGDFVLTQNDVLVSWRKPDVVALGSYSVDSPGAVQRFAKRDGRGGAVALLEGGIQSPSLCAHTVPPFHIPYRALLPRRAECTNLLVPVALSATQVALNAVRMEPQWMMLGHSSGVAAAWSARQRLAVQDVDVAALQRRLVQLGQILNHTMGPGSNSTLPPGPRWYAWKPMWNVTGLQLTALQDQAVLKKSFASSKTLPPAERRFYPAGAVLPLAAPPVPSPDPEYLTVTLTELNVSYLEE